MKVMTVKVLLDFRHNRGILCSQYAHTFLLENIAKKYPTKSERYVSPLGIRIVNSDDNSHAQCLPVHVINSHLQLCFVCSLVIHCYSI